ncbi:MAG: hypothetical protein JXR70_09395 [Spirochaetales bacterium]|nr:hypothetical protein [Spirochaetales bacterium]
MNLWHSQVSFTTYASNKRIPFGDKSIISHIDFSVAVKALGFSGLSLTCGRGVGIVGIVLGSAGPLAYNLQKNKFQLKIPDFSYPSITHIFGFIK